MKIKKLISTAHIPTYGTDAAAGADLYSTGSEYINPYSHKKVHTGLAMEIPEGYFGAIFPRSGLATKKGLRLANCVAVIDQDYRGEVLVPLYNDSEYLQEIHEGERIAQLVIIPYKQVEFEVVDQLDETDRGGQGFGSTGFY